MNKNELNLDFLEEDNKPYINNSQKLWLFKKFYGIKVAIIIFIIIFLSGVLSIIYYKDLLGYFKSVKPSSSKTVVPHIIANTDPSSDHIASQNIVYNADNNSLNQAIYTDNQTTSVSYQQPNNYYPNNHPLNIINKPIDITEEINNSLGSIVNTSKEMLNNIEEMANIIRGIKSKINNINFITVKLSNNTEDLSININKHIENKLDLTFYRPKNNKVISYNQKLNYVLHAIVPGRAWLKSACGEIISVVQGDSLDHYGKIIIIDPANYLVRTSSGIIIR